MIYSSAPRNPLSNRDERLTLGSNYPQEFILPVPRHSRIPTIPQYPHPNTSGELATKEQVVPILIVCPAENTGHRVDKAPFEKFVLCIQSVMDDQPNYKSVSPYGLRKLSVTGEGVVGFILSWVSVFPRVWFWLTKSIRLWNSGLDIIGIGRLARAKGGAAPDFLGAISCELRSGGVRALSDGDLRHHVRLEIPRNRSRILVLDCSKRRGCPVRTTSRWGAIISRWV